MEPGLTPRSSCDGADARADYFVASWHLGKAAQEGAQIEECAADEDRPTVARLDLPTNLGGPFGPGNGIDFFFGLRDVEEMVRDPLTHEGGRFRAPDVEAAVDLDGIVVDDLAANGLGEADGKLGFARSSRAGDDDRGHLRRRVRCVRSSSSCRTLRRCARQ